MLEWQNATLAFFTYYLLLPGISVIFANRCQTRWIYQPVTMQIVYAIILILLYALGWLLVIVVGGIVSLVQHLMEKKANKATKTHKKKVKVADEG